MRKEDINLREVIENETGNRFNKNNKISCPFHSDSTPSLSIKDNKWHCFSCGRGQDVIDFIMDLKDVNYVEACRYLDIDLNNEYKTNISQEEAVKRYIDWQLSNIEDFRSWKLVKLYRFSGVNNETLYYTAKFSTPGKKEIRYYSIVDDKVKMKRNGAAVPYNYYKLNKALKEKKNIFICEGEKDVDTLTHLGYIATSFKGVKEFNWKVFKGIVINFVGDTGQAGEEYKEFIWSKVKNYTPLFNIIIPEGIEILGDNADITDWFKAGHTKEEFKAIVNKSYNGKNSRKPVFLSDKGKVIPPILANIVAEDIIYKQYMKSDYKYNGFYYEKIQDVECLQKEIKHYIPLELQTTRTINETMNLLKIDNTISSLSENEYISLNNGLINVKNGKIKEHTPEIFSLFKIPCEYKGKESMDKLINSRFYQYLKTTFKNDTDTIILVSEILGASLLPNPKLFKKIIFLLGDGSNGKSVFINIMQALHGNIFSTVPLKDIDSNRFSLAGMIGKKINVDADASGTRLEETSNLKKIATGDYVSIEEKGKQAVNGVLNVLLVVGLNKMPSSADKSYGFLRRNTILPFNQTFVNPSDTEAIAKGALPVDVNLESDIINNEMDVVLAFALAGLQRLLKNNYNTTSSKVVEAATKEYQLENDSVMAFYEFNKDGEDVQDYSAAAMYTLYETWCINSLKTPVSTTSFGTRFTSYYKKVRGSKGYVYKNVRMNR